MSPWNKDSRIWAVRTGVRAYMDATPLQNKIKQIFNGERFPSEFMVIQDSSWISWKCYEPKSFKSLSIGKITTALLNFELMQISLMTSTYVVLQETIESLSTSNRFI